MLRRAERVRSQDFARFSVKRDRFPQASKWIADSGKTRVPKPEKNDPYRSYKDGTITITHMSTKFGPRSSEKYDAAPSNVVAVGGSLRASVAIRRVRQTKSRPVEAETQCTGTTGKLQTPVHQTDQILHVKGAAL
ncbi:MAG: hypothetical protein IPP63_19160 [Chloracidobacterium sp.]|nr:hypothetical protein [Chloracidobacterium sp.]